ncbi:MAG: YraN family protein [Planctomycetota bacterium]|jgi:putative endonuclease
MRFRGAIRAWVIRWRYGALAPGERGERYAARWLARRGYRILERNVAVGRDEADLLALAPDGSVVIVEVKTRQDPGVWPETAVGLRKRRRLTRLATRLAARRGYGARPIRFDVVAVTWPAGGVPTIRHFADAFETP